MGLINNGIDVGIGGVSMSEHATFIGKLFIEKELLRRENDKLTKELETTKKQNMQMKNILKFVFNPYSAPEESYRRLQERYAEVDSILNKPLTET